MKIAIMTQPLGRNYGGVMQAWALQQALKRMGHDPVTVDRQPDKPGIIYDAARLTYRACLKALGKRKAPINPERDLPTIIKSNREFIAQHIKTSEPLYSTRQLKDHFGRENYDAVIVGSDQTWRPKYSPGIYNYFLDFLEDSSIIRIAYASSFGVDQWEFTEEQTTRCAELAKKFDWIGVREDSGVHLCRQYLGVDATHVVDPTLLLDKEDYLLLIGPERLKETQGGVYTYFLDKTPEKLLFAKRVGEELGEAVYSCQAIRNLGDEFTNVNDFVMPDIRDWLAGFSNARIVLTDSFHGVAFSLMFQKPFFVVINERRGSARFESLLSLSGHTSRSVSSQHLADVSIQVIEHADPEHGLADVRLSSRTRLFDELRKSASPGLKSNVAHR